MVRFVWPKENYTPQPPIKASGMVHHCGQLAGQLSHLRRLGWCIEVHDQQGILG